MSDGDDRPEVLVQTRYDRFPATVKGAFVLRGGDANPHLVRVVRAGIDSVSGGASKDISMGNVDVDVAPGRDLFVPFEAAIAELEPGWYVIAAAFVIGSTSKPSIAASSALIGSTSVTITFAPRPAARDAMPRAHQP